ncbi:MAG: EAL domain-containing protein [Phycisphaerales bacterium]
MSRRQKVLVIDDDSMIHNLVKIRLKDLKVEVVCAADGRRGLEIAQEEDIDLVLLDVSMPLMTGFEVCRHLRDDPRTRDLPVIFLTGSDDAGEKVRGFELGAVDYVTKPFDAAELRARVRAALRTQALVHALEAQAETDNLTGLPNRKAFQRAVIRCIEHARQHPDHYKFAVMFLDLDRFKIINDSLGHGIGDELLIAISNTLHRCVREVGRGGSRDLVARMGGDEFAILLDDIPDLGAATSVAERLIDELSQPYDLQGYQVVTGTSVGIRLCRGDCETADALLRDSDTAMYHAKAGGKGRYVVFDDEMHARVLDRLELENDLRGAVDAGQLTLFYQPLVSISDGSLVGFEALSRWRHPSRGIVSPDQYIGIAEETNLILEIGRLALREACRNISLWRRDHANASDIQVHVNLSKVQLNTLGFVDHVISAMRDFEVEPSSLVLEVTESVIMHNSKSVVPVLEELRELGLRLAMDDFGTGYSSLASLHRFPIDILKIDKAFIHAIDSSRPHAAIVDAIVKLAHNLGMDVVAEGIETPNHLALLQALECDLAQGYFFGKPVSADNAAQFISNPGRLAKSA